MKVKIPTAALINGYYKGPLPDALAGLNNIEVSMIQIYSTQTTMVIQGGKFHHKISAVYNMVNDIARVAESLPAMPDYNSIAILRSEGWKKTKDYNYRPNRVKAALSWLKKNNSNYADIPINFDLLPNSDEAIDVEVIPMTEDVNDALEPSNNMDNVSSHNTGYIGEEIMLLSAGSVKVGPEQQLRSALNSLDGAPIMKRGSSNVFINCFTDNKMFWEKSNILLFPYGHGGPSSEHLFGKLTMPQFHKNCLMQGLNDDRRCQSNPLYIFLAYETEMKRQIGSVSMLASKSVNNIAGADNGEADRDPTIAEVDEVREHLNPLNVDHPAIPKSNVEKDKRIRKLMSRMMPYSKALDGSAIMIANERKKLLSLLSAPVIVAEGNWSYFLTFAPADVYDHKLFDILIEST